MIGLCCDKTYSEMNKYYNGYDDEDHDGNEDGNNNDNAASVSVSDGPIFDPITTPHYCVRGVFNNGDSYVAVVHYVSTCHNIYIPYKYHIKDVP